MQRVIAFDADDTLWHNENIFEKVHARYFALLSRTHDAATVERALYETEMRNLGLYGYGIKGFMLSAVETAIRLTNGAVSGDELLQVIAAGREMLDHPVELIEGAAGALDALAGRHRLILITKGDLRDQERKIAKSGLASRFESAEIVSEKDLHTYSRILSRMGVAPRGLLMVGNSLKSDILPVLAQGGSGVHVPYRILWRHEHASHDDPVMERALLEGRFFRTDSLAGLPAIVDEWERRTT